MENKPIVEGQKAVFKVGDKVTIECGYNYQHTTIFTGYVADIKTKFPLELVCEDAMWLFKQQSFKKTFAKVTVKELVDFLLTKAHGDFKVVYSFPGLQLGKFRINTATGAQVLDELRERVVLDAGRLLAQVLPLGEAVRGHVALGAHQPQGFVVPVGAGAIGDEILGSLRVRWTGT